MPPFVSIILPVRNEEQYIITCLDSIAAQDYPHDQMEILVVDGLSTDSTKQKIEEFRIQNSETCPETGKPAQQTNGFSILVLENPKQTVSSGLNIGFRKARGQVLMRMDAHASYGSDYISQCLKVMEKTGAANVGGPALALPGGPGPMAQAITLAHYSPFGLGGAQFRDPNAEGFVETVWPGCFKREVFDQIGYIDERRTRTEDIEFNSRLREAGYKIYLSPLIKAYYYCRTTLGETWRQRWADGYEITHFLPDNPRAPRLRHFIPFIFVTSLILLTALSLSGLGADLWGRGAGTKLANLLHGFKGLGLKQPGLFSLKAWSWHLLFLRMLALELFAYFSAMLLAVIQAGQAKFTVYNSKFENNTVPTENGPTVNCKLAPGSLALLPLVFVTLHFSYGLGSLWGLVTLAGWAGKRSNA